MRRIDRDHFCEVEPKHRSVYCSSRPDEGTDPRFTFTEAWICSFFRLEHTSILPGMFQSTWLYLLMTALVAVGSATATEGVLEQHSLGKRAANDTGYEACEMCDFSSQFINYAQWPPRTGDGPGTNIFWFEAIRDPARELARINFSRNGRNAHTRVHLCPQGSARISIDDNVPGPNHIPALYMEEFGSQCKAAGAPLGIPQTNTSCPTFEMPPEPRTYLMEPRRFTPSWRTELSISVLSNKVAQLVMVNKADQLHTEVLVNMRGDVRVTTVYQKTGMYVQTTRLNPSHIQDKTAQTSCTSVRSLNSTDRPQSDRGGQ